MNVSNAHVGQMAHIKPSEFNNDHTSGWKEIVDVAGTSCNEPDGAICVRLADDDYWFDGQRVIEIK